jgi:predicted dehydrogenase
MLEKEADNIDAVIIATPFKTHYDIVMACLDAGKPVFCEKTMAHSYECCRDIVTKCHDTGLFVQVGHQRRYNPEYNYAATQMLQKKRLGRVGYIEAQWHRNDAWRRPWPKKNDGSAYVLNAAEKKWIHNFEKHWNWRIYEEYSSGLLSELATHHLEIVNFLLGAMPSRVWGTGGIDYWRDGRTVYDNLTVTYEYDMSKRFHGFGTVDAKIEEQDVRKINQPYTVRVTWSGTLQSAKKGASMLVVGNEGTFELRERWKLEDPGCIFFQEPVKVWLDPETMEPTTDPKVIEWIKITGQSQKYSRWDEQDPVPFEKEMDPSWFNITPDVRQFDAFAKHVKDGGKPRVNEMTGLMASVCDIAGHEAVTTKQLVEIDPAIYTFDFETPNPFEYETIEA